MQVFLRIGSPVYDKSTHDSVHVRSTFPYSHNALFKDMVAVINLHARKRLVIVGDICITPPPISSAHFRSARQPKPYPGIIITYNH